MKYLYYTVLSVGIVLLASGCSSKDADLEKIKKPKVHQVVDADLIVDENTTKGTPKKLPYVYDNVDASRQKNLNDIHDNGIYLNEQAEQSKAAAEAFDQRR
jgi:hypothetical protein